MSMLYQMDAITCKSEYVLCLVVLSPPPVVRLYDDEGSCSESRWVLLWLCFGSGARLASQKYWSITRSE